MTYRHDRRRAALKKDRVRIDWHRASTQGNLPRWHSAPAAPHPLAGVTPAPQKPRRGLPVNVIDTPIEWVTEEL